MSEIKCPNCGSEELERVKKDTIIAFTYDGEPVIDDEYRCKNCTSLFPLDYLEMFINENSEVEKR